MDWVVKGLIFVLAVDILLFMGQMATQTIANDIGLDYNMSYINTESLAINGVKLNNDWILNDASIQGNFLGDLTQGVDQDTLGIFIDPIGTISNWLINNIPGVKYVLVIVSGPYGYVKALGVPDWFSFSIGAMWYILTLFLIVMLIIGRS